MSRYGELADLYAYGAPSASFGSLSDATREAALDSASEEIDAALRARGPLPLTSWGRDVTQKCCHIAAYELMAVIGFNPAAGSDQNLLVRANVARDWIRAVSRSELHPNVVYAVTPNPKAQPRVRSNARRGF